MEDSEPLFPNISLDNDLPAVPRARLLEGRPPAAVHDEASDRSKMDLFDSFRFHFQRWKHGGNAPTYHPLDITYTFNARSETSKRTNKSRDPLMDYGKARSLREQLGLFGILAEAKRHEADRRGASVEDLLGPFIRKLCLYLPVEDLVALAFTCKWIARIVHFSSPIYLISQVTTVVRPAKWSSSLEKEANQRAYDNYHLQLSHYHFFAQGLEKCMQLQDPMRQLPWNFCGFCLKWVQTLGGTSGGVLLLDLYLNKAFVVETGTFICTKCVQHKRPCLQRYTKMPTAVRVYSVASVSMSPERETCPALPVSATSDDRFVWLKHNSGSITTMLTVSDLYPDKPEWLYNMSLSVRLPLKGNFFPSVLRGLEFSPQPDSGNFE